MTNIANIRQEYAQGFGKTNKQQRTEKHRQLDIWLGNSKCGGTSDTEINTETDTLKDFVRSLNQKRNPHKELVIYRMLKLTLYKLHDKVNKESSFRYNEEKLNNALTSCCVGFPDLQNISNYLQDNAKVDNHKQMEQYSRFKNQLTKFVAHRDNRIKTNQRPLFARLETTSFEKILMVLNSRISECQQKVAKSRRQPNTSNLGAFEGKANTSTPIPTPIQGAFEGKADTSILSVISALDLTKRSATLLYVNCYLADFNVASIAQINQARGKKDIIDMNFFAALINPNPSSETDPEFSNINKLRTMIHQSCSKASQARELVKNLKQILKQHTPASNEANPLPAAAQSRANDKYLEQSMPEFKEQTRNEQMALLRSNSLKNITPAIIRNNLERQFNGTPENLTRREYVDYLKKELSRTSAKIIVCTSKKPQEPLISMEFTTCPNLNQIANEDQLQHWQRTAIMLVLDQNIMEGLRETIQTSAYGLTKNVDGRYSNLSKPDSNRKFADCKITFNDDNTMTVDYTITSYYHTTDDLTFTLNYSIQLTLKPKQLLHPEQDEEQIDIGEIADSKLNFLDLFEITNVQLNSVTDAKIQHNVELIKNFEHLKFKNDLDNNNLAALNKRLLTTFCHLDEFDKNIFIDKICSKNGVPDFERVKKIANLDEQTQESPLTYGGISEFKKYFLAQPIYTNNQSFIQMKDLLASNELDIKAIQRTLTLYSTKQFAQLIDGLSNDELNKLKPLVNEKKLLSYSAQQIRLDESMLKTKQQLQESPSLLDELYKNSPELFSSRLISLASTKSWDSQPLENFVNNSSGNIFNEILNYVIANLPTVRLGFWQQCLESLLTGANKNSRSTIDQNRLLTQQFLEALNSINSIEIRSFIKGCSYETFTKLVEYMDNNEINAPLLSKRLMHAPRYLCYCLGHLSLQKFDLLKINSILSAITKLPDVVQYGFIAQLDEHAVHKLAQQLNDDHQSALPPELSGFLDKVKRSAIYSKYALNVLSPFNVERDNYDALIQQIANNLALLSEKQLDSFWTELNLIQKSTIMWLLQENKITNSLLTKICNGDKSFNTSYENFKLLHPIISAPACATAIQQDPILFYCCIQQLHNVDKNLTHIISIYNNLPNILQSLQQINLEVRQTQFNGNPDGYESWLQSETKTRQKKHFELSLGADSDAYKYIETTMDSYVAPLAALKQLLDWGLTNEQIQSLAQGLYPTARQGLNNLVRLNYPQHIATAEATLPPEILADTDKLNMLKSTKILGTYVTDLTRPQFQQLIIIDHNGLPVINFTNIDISNHANIEHFKTQFETKIYQARDKDKIQLKLFTIQTLQTIILAKISAILSIHIRQVTGLSSTSGFSVNTKQNLKTLYVDIPSGKIYLQTTISVINNANEQCLTDYSADYSADFTLAENFTLPEQGADIIASDVITITKTSPLSKTESLELTNKIEEHVSNAIDVSQDVGQPSS